jgi:hypothetical protein
VSKITSDLLYDTLNVIQLARETAIYNGKTAQAERLAPVADHLRDLVASSRQSPSQASSADVMSQPELRFLLSKTQNPSSLAPNRSTSAADTHHVIRAMAAGGMNEVDIARHVGMTREEIHLVLAMMRARGARSQPPEYKYTHD